MKMVVTTTRYLRNDTVTSTDPTLNCFLLQKMPGGTDVPLYLPDNQARQVNYRLSALQKPSNSLLFNAL